jgi:glycosyltransferase involved in cell wall biosynthesis
MKISVLVTTFGRRAYLERCIDSLLAQKRLPDEIVIVTRNGDTDTEQYVARLLADRKDIPIKHGRVSDAGVLAANRVGLDVISGDIVAFLDDDAAAWPDWLSRIERWYANDPKIGAVGGRDVIHTERGVVRKTTKTVGRISWYGRIVGNHEKVFRGAAEVEHLKGVNMSFRRELLPPFDDFIVGNAHHYETDLCFAVRRKGYKVLFDGDLVVDHYQDAPRHLKGNQAGADEEREFFIHRNRVYVMMKNLAPARRGAFLFYTFVIDASSDLGEVLLRKPGINGRIWRAMMRGKVAGVRSYLQARSRLP